MKSLRWTWDRQKNDANRRTHGLSFDVAVLVFDDPLAATTEDPYPDEARWRTMGMVGPIVVMVVHTWPEADPVTGDAVGRIISARKATSHERRGYAEGNL